MRHLEFLDVPIEHDDLNQKFLSSLAPEWLVYTIVWRNRDDPDTISLDDVYNPIKVYEPESEVPTASVPTASTQVSTASTDVLVASLSHDTICAYKATQSNGSQIKFEDITQIDDDDIEEMDIKWNLALLSIRADRFWKKTGKKITIQGSDVAGFDKSKVECFNCHKMAHFARECRAPRSQDKGMRESYRKDPKVEEPAPKALMAIDGIGWDWSYMADEEENHALVADDVVPTEFALMAMSSLSSNNEVNETKLCERIKVLERDLEVRDNKIEYLKNELEEVKKEKENIDHKLIVFEKATTDLDSLLGEQRPVKDKTGLGFNVVPPPPAQVYSPPKKDLSWTGLPEFADDTITDYSRPTPSIDVSKDVTDEQQACGKGIVLLLLNKENHLVAKGDKFTNEVVGKKQTPKQIHPRGKQRNWKNQKSQQLGKDFLMQNKACYKCGCFDHLASNCSIWVDKGETWPRLKNSNMSPRAILLKSGSKPIVVNKPKMNVAQPKMTSFVKTAHLKRPFERKTTAKNQLWVPKVPTGGTKVLTGRTKVPTGRTKFPTVGSNVPTVKPTVAPDLGNKGKAIKASAHWI
ncbi:ribonuclease H-like domain-containing protein [Tanacetum coccineum]